MKATEIITAIGEKLIVESGAGRCWHSEEVAEFDVNVPAATICDICEQEITEP